MYNNIISKKTLILLIPIISFIIGFIYLEDSTGGAKNDYDIHEKWILGFFNDFKETLKNYGSNDDVRNLPTFYILSSRILTLGLDISFLRYFNLLSLLIIIIFFYKCLKLKFKNLNAETIFFLVSCLLLSPTIRSLINYPYPFIWGISFFIISIFYFLKFKLEETNFLKNSALCVTYLSVSSYFTPNFSVFILYYFFFFYLKFRFNKNLIIIILLSIILSLPALAFLLLKDFYMFKKDVLPLGSIEKYNFFNKVIIISSFLILFFLPFLSFGKIYQSNLKKKFLILSFTF